MFLLGYMFLHVFFEIIELTGDVPVFTANTCRVLFEIACITLIMKGDELGIEPCGIIYEEPEEQPPGPSL